MKQNVRSAIMLQKENPFQDHMQRSVGENFQANFFAYAKGHPPALCIPCVIRKPAVFLQPKHFPQD